MTTHNKQHHRNRRKAKKPHGEHHTDHTVSWAQTLELRHVGGDVDGDKGQWNEWVRFVVKHGQKICCQTWEKNGCRCGTETMWAVTPRAVDSQGLKRFFKRNRHQHRSKGVIVIAWKLGLCKVTVAFFLMSDFCWVADCWKLRPHQQIMLWVWINQCMLSKSIENIHLILVDYKQVKDKQGLTFCHYHLLQNIKRNWRWPETISDYWLLHSCQQSILVQQLCITHHGTLSST